MSNLAQRIGTAVVAIPVIIWLCMTGGLPFAAFVIVISGVALHEYFRLAAAKGARPLVFPGLIAGFFINISFYHVKLRYWLTGLFDHAGVAIPFPSQSQLLIIILLITVVVLTLIELFRNGGSAILNLGTTLFGLLYIPLFFGTFIGIREVFLPEDFPVLRYFADASALHDPAVHAAIYRWGGYTVISVFATIWICDTAAFHVGSAAGRHKLYPRVSPNKSWEGAIAGFIAALLSAAAARALVLPYLPLSGALLIGAIVGTIGQLGDLAESLLKRDAGVKDSSSLIPGHGGAFDRFDSLLLVAPCVYLYLDYILFT
ncbi:MAG TPA: phosphatidate cytidylyltransferase [Bacteroidota bacterium]|nr:phosphatidate cytidylyltransferase [Bacteroidota bacterium]